MGELDETEGFGEDVTLWEIWEAVNRRGAFEHEGRAGCDRRLWIRWKASDILEALGMVKILRDIPR